MAEICCICSNDQSLKDLLTEGSSELFRQRTLQNNLRDGELKFLCGACEEKLKVTKSAEKTDNNAAEGQVTVKSEPMSEENEGYSLGETVKEESSHDQLQIKEEDSMICNEQEDLVENVEDVEDGQLRIKDEDSVHFNEHEDLTESIEDMDGSTLQARLEETCDEAAGSVTPRQSNRIKTRMNILKKRSPSWNFFDEILEGEKAKCKYCQSVISFRGGNVYNMLRHLKMKHADILADTALPGTSTANAISETRERMLCDAESMDFSADAKDFQTNMRAYAAKLPNKSKQVHKQLVRMIVKEFQPISIVEAVEFKKLLNMLNPSYMLPSRKTLTSKFIPQMYESVKDEIRASVSKASSICITTDAWISRNAERFIGVTAHFITEECSLESALLDCIEFYQSPSAEIISHEMQRVFVEWGIESKITAVVTDNAVNIVSAVQKGNWRHLRCMAHCLNLVVQDALKEIREVQFKVKSIVDYFKKNSEASTMLSFLQNQLNVESVQLKQDVVTRWNSTYHMFKLILEIKEPVNSSLALSNVELPTLSQKDWTIIDRTCSILKIFDEVTAEISSEKEVSLSKELIFVNAMRTSTRNVGVESDLDEVKRLIFKLIDGLNKRFGSLEENPLVLEATLLDPRYKKLAFPHETAFCNAYQLLSKNASDISLQQDVVDPSPTPSLATATTSQIWAEFDKKVSSATTTTAVEVTEIDKYLQEAYAPRNSDPLAWWGKRKMYYPRLYEVMKKRLCIVATSVPAERIFSKSGVLQCEKRSCMSSSNVSQIVFLNSNLK